MVRDYLLKVTEEVLTLTVSTAFKNQKGRTSKMSKTIAPTRSLHKRRPAPLPRIRRLLAAPCPQGVWA